MSASEIEFEIDEFGRVTYRVIDDGVLLSKDEKKLIIAHVMRLAAENAKLRELCSELLRIAESNDPDFLHWPEISDELRKLGVKVDKL